MLGTFVSHRFRPALLLVLVVGFIVALQVTPAFAATLTVDSTADGTLAALNGNGTCDLREAIQAANTNANVGECTGTGYAAVDTINITATGTITLTAGQLVIKGPAGEGVIINGGGIIISGNTATRVFLIGEDTVNDALARSLTLNSVIVQAGSGTGDSGGSPSTNGGCVLVRPNSSFTLSASRVRDCNSVSDGGGIYADEDSTVVVTAASFISGNIAEINGGGIAMTTGEITVDLDSCIENNTAFAVGGGIYAGDSVRINVGGGSVTNRGFFVNNTAATGGAIYMDVNSTLDGNHARFFGNTASFGSALFSAGGSGRLGETTIGRRCVNCCIVGNSGTQAVRQTVSGLNANFVNNWWGSNFGPYIAGAGSGTASGTSAGDGISGNGISAVNVGISSIPADYGSESTGGDSNWLRITDGDVPSDCLNDVCNPVSVANRSARSCTYVKNN